MRKEFLLFIAVVSLLNCQRRPADQNIVDKDCEKGKNLAQLDIKNNSLGLYFFGLPDSRLNTKIRLLTTKYKIVSKGGGDIISTEGKCYNEVMEKEILRRLGDDFFLKIDKMVDSIFAAGGGDREASYSGGRAAVDRFLACNLNFFNVQSQDKKPVLYVEMVIDTLGNVRDVAIKKSYSEKFDNEARRVLKKMNGWLPAMENGKKIDSRVILQVKFDPNIKCNS